MMQVQTGAVSYNKAIADAIKKVARISTEVLYPTGHVDKLDVATRRAALTGVNQTAAEINLQYAKEAGCDYVDKTAHAGARPSHAVWQGRVFCISGNDKEYPPFYESTGYGTGPGLCGWNCRHNFHAYFPGISSPAYTKSMLKEYDSKNMEYNGVKYTEYEVSQMQRAHERKIRETKRKLAGYDAGMKNTDDEASQSLFQKQFNEESVRLKQQEKALKDFCKKTGRQYESARTQVHAVKDDKGNIVGFNRSVARKAVWANQKTHSNESRFSDRFHEYNNGQKDTIIYKKLLNNLNKSEIGKEVAEYIVDHPEIRINMLYKVDNPDNLYGMQDGDDIYIFAQKPKLFHSGNIDT